MTWANVDDLFPEHPKVLAAGGDAAWLYVCGLCFTNRNLTEGRIPKAVVPRLSDRKGPMRLAAKLVDVGLWHDDGDHFTIHDWGKYNENADEVKARKEHARTAARARWGGRPTPPSGNAPPMPGAMPGASAEHASGTMPNRDRAMPSHSSPTPDLSSSSSNHQVGPPSADDDDDDDDESRTLNRARSAIADRRIAALVQPPANPRAYRSRVLRDVDAAHGDDLRRLVGEGLGVEAIADALCPPAPAAAASPAHAKWVPDADDEPVWDEAIDDAGHLVVVPRRSAS